jgi:dihydropyrimidinase
LRTADSFFEGTRAAAFGGTTCIVGFAKAHGELGLAAGTRERIATASAAAAVDFSFHATIDRSGLTDEVVNDLIALIDDGITSWKFFTAYPDTMMVDDATLLKGFTLAAENGALPLIHAENGAIVAWETQRLLHEGRVAENMHLFAHPAEAEREAIQRVIALASFAGTPVFIVHVSSELAEEALRRARATGARVWGETCPHYLVKAYEDYADLGADAAKYVCAPPIRERANQDVLWRALADGTLSTVGTDHASYLFTDVADLPPQKARGRGCFAKIPVGVPGIEDRMTVMLDAGVRTGRLSLERFVEVTASAPARIFGMYPRKGTITVGADADLVLWSCDTPRVLGVKAHHMRSDYSLYEGMSVNVAPREVLLRGETIVADGEFLGRAGGGRFIERKKVETT